MPSGKGQKKAKAVNLSFAIDCSTPVEDEIMDAGSFVSLIFVYEYGAWTVYPLWFEILY